ncbi:MAG TPA: CocE/NonD family hydrolase [Candidatus Binatia bacterium]|jgi:predicted acyl esterase|nr:CocE/NonD family hydrolase [Candidatus Binatia bacterium]
MLMRLAAVLVTALLAPASAAIVPSLFDGRLPCVVTAGVQYCEGGLGKRVESWDGVPLDVNVTLPPADMSGPFPLIVDIHGWGIGKTNGAQAPRALQGYVVVSYSARGFQGSCGVGAARATDPTLTDPDICLKRGWIRLADARYEVRDTQYLAGVLADEGIVTPNKIGVTGASYGGGQSMTLAVLRNRTMLPDGTLVPWTSPGGLPMEIAAAAPLIPWTDMAEALTPAGRTLDYRVDNPYGERAGIQKQSWVDVLYNTGLGAGFYAPPGMDPDADLPGWNARLSEGEPYDGDPLIAHALNEITTHHSSYYIDDSIPPAPIFIYNSWVDDLFPGDEALRFYRRTRARHPDAEIAVQLAAGFGHPRAALAGANLAALGAAIDTFFARHLKDSGDPPLPGITTYTQGCAGITTEEGPFTATDWDALRPGEVRFTSDAAQTFDQVGNPAVAVLLDPLTGPPCRTMPLVDDATSANYELPRATGAGYTLMGAPLVIADITVSGNYAQVVARLWDVGPDSKQTLISHLLYRPRSDNENPQVFQLHPNGWHFATGHVPKLELLGQSAPFGRAPSGTYTVTVENLELRLPVLEAPDGAIVQAPAATVLPPSAEDSFDTGPPACPPVPVDDCRTGAKASLKAKDSTKPDRDLVVFKWKTRGTGDPTLFGDPTGTTAYSACIYDGNDDLVTSATLLAGGGCRGSNKKTHPCWTGKRTGFTFATRDASPIAQLVMQAGKKSTDLFLRAQGAGLTLPAQTSLRLQLHNSVGTCWEGAS